MTVEAGSGAGVTAWSLAPQTPTSKLDRMFRPRSVAVIGASPNPSFVSGIFKNLLRYGYTGSVVGRQPRYDAILDAPCYPSILDVPGHARPGGRRGRQSR